MAKIENAVVVKELAERGDAELKSLLDSKVEELHGVKFKHALGQLQETHTIKALKHDIARLQTVLSQRAQAAEVQS